MKRLYYDYYFHRQENLWRQNALKTLPALMNSSDMLACGEDLGLIPSCVHPVRFLHRFSLQNSTFTFSNYCNMLKTWIYGGTTLMQVMQELGLIGLRIQRMPNEPGLEFGIPSHYSYMTVKTHFRSIFKCLSYVVLMFVYLTLGMCSIVPRLFDSPCLVGRRWRAKAQIFQGHVGLWHASTREMHAGDCTVRFAPARWISFDVGNFSTSGKLNCILTWIKCSQKFSGLTSI